MSSPSPGKRRMDTDVVKLYPFFGFYLVLIRIVLVECLLLAEDGKSVADALIWLRSYCAFVCSRKMQTRHSCICNGHADQSS